MSANDDLLDATIRHQIGLHRFSTHTLRKAIAMLNRIDPRLRAQIRKYDPATGSGSWSRKRLALLLQAVRDIIDEAYIAITDEVDQSVAGLAGYEAEYQKGMIEHAVPAPIVLDIVTPAAPQLYAAVHSKPFAGMLLKDWYKGLADGTKKRVRDAISQGYVEGRTTDQIVRDLMGTKAAKYADGVLEGSRRGIEAMVRTALNHTATTARNKVYEANQDVIARVQWVSTLDARTTAVCRGRDGQVYPLDSGPRPPAHINCLPGDSLVLAGGRVTGASKRWFEGELVSVRTSGGREIRATPNHPVLTDRGWIGIGRLNRGDKLLCIREPERASASVDTGDHDVETSIEDKAEAFFRHRDVATMPVPTSGPDFHGDGAGSEVAIIGADRSLLAVREAKPVEHARDGLLNMGGAAAQAFERHGALLFLAGALLAPAGRDVGSARQRPSRGGVHAIHAGMLLVTATTDRYAGGGQDSLDGAWADAEFIRDSANADAFGVELDDVVDVERSDFRGHVFNLETERHVYYVGGIVTHNCRSTTVPVLRSWEEMGIDLPELSMKTRASMDGQVAADLTYDTWLRRQTVAFQEEILGVKKAKLFRDGELTLDKFIDRKGKEYTLEQLRDRESAAWSKAFPEFGEDVKGLGPDRGRGMPLARALGEIDAKARMDVMQLGQQTGFEFLTVIDRTDGSYLAKNFSSNKPTSVGIPGGRFDSVARDPSADLVAHHNHPSSTSFSPADLFMLEKYPGVTELYAHGHNGSLYMVNSVAAGTKEYLNQVLMPYLNAYWQKPVGAGQITATEVNQVVMHALMIVLARKKLISYEFELQGASLKTMRKHAALFEAFIEDVMAQ